jgi:hypothetical protein
MSTRVLVLTALALPILASSAPARTWYVSADGSGDAPTIAAAIDSTTGGDVILVGPGTHFASNAAGGAVDLQAGTSLRSEAGPAVTFIKPGSPPFQPGIVSTNDNCLVSGFTVLGFGNTQAAVFVGGDYVEISNNIIDGANGTSAIAVAGNFASIHHNVCFGGTGLGGICLCNDFEGADIYGNIILNGISHVAPCPANVQIHCNLINGPTSTCVRYYNFSADPMFCAAGNYYLHSDSPCAPGNHPDGIDCGLIGPLPVGCGPVSTETRTWGSIKAMYRD